MLKATLHADNPEIRPLLLKGNFGLEKESLRIDGGGFLAQTPAHFADNVHIVRDFSENQVEVNTEIAPTPQEAVDLLEGYTAQVQETLRHMDEREYLWPFSNPPYIRSERDIPIAQYTGDEASKTVYREYLSDRYGRYKMAFSGIHLNYSFADELLRADFALSGYDDFDRYRDDLYVKLAKKSVIYGWILTAVMAASPIMDSSFVEKGKIGGELFQGLATVRCSELGYWNFFAPILDYDSAAAYADSIQQYIDNGLIRYPSELYYPIRLKPRGEYGLQALREGISHIELRMVDLNPLVRAGIDVRDVLFSQLLLVWMAATPDEVLATKDQVQAVQNFKNAAHYDLKTVKIVMPNGDAFSVVKTANKLIDALEEFYAGFGPEVGECLAFQRAKFENPENRYAWKIRHEYGAGYVARGLELARKLQADYLNE
ncbi:MAG: hypothetical protein HFJ66_04985 [Eggerthellaceae bacterium]|nr:hypothetical protein [Eggerthellaceae bacterium]